MVREADGYGLEAVVHARQFYDALAGVYGEVAGGEGGADQVAGFLAKLDAFSQAMERTHLRYLTAATANAPVLGGVFRRFLTEGLFKGKSSGGPAAIDLSSGNVALARERYLAVWEDYLTSFLKLTLGALPVLRNAKEKDWAAMHPNERGAYVAAIEDIYDLFMKSEGFMPSEGRPKFLDEWTYVFVKHQLLKIRNAMGQVVAIRDLLSSEVPERFYFETVHEVMDRFATDPLDHLTFSFANEPRVRPFIDLSVPEKAPKIRPENPIQLRRIMDRLIYLVGQGGGARVKARWEEESHRLVFEGASNPFHAFETPEVQDQLLDLSLEFGDMASINFLQNGATGWIESVAIAVPLISLHTVMP